MKQLITTLSLLLVLATTATAAQKSYSLEKVSPNLYAAIANPVSAATSNAFFYVGKSYVIAGGAHMTEQATKDLLSAIKEVTGRPVRYFILPHHHPGYTSVDFYFPEDIDVIMTYPVWQALQQEVIPFNNEAILYSDGMTLKIDGVSLILTNMGRAHSRGDTLVYIPEERTLFTSDLLYVKSVGYMGEGQMEDWVVALEFMDQFEMKKVIPGYGPLSKPEVIGDYKKYFKSFLSEVIRHIEAGDSLEKTKKEFNLPQYRHYSGYDHLLELNIDRAYRNLKETVLAR